MKPVDGDSVGGTTADTVIINLDTYKNYLPYYPDAGITGDLKANARLMYKAVSTAGTPALKIAVDFSPDSTNWVEAFTYEDSIKTETWNVDTLPTAVKWYKYMRFIATGVSTSNNTDTAWWLWLAIKKR